jgi:hypothetical protein
LNLISILKELWNRRLFVVASTFAAGTISILVVFHLSLLPPSIAKRSQAEASGSIAILVDSTSSPIADAKRDLTGLTARAAVFARYMAGGNVIQRIARSNGIPAEQIDVAGPVPLPGQAPGIEPTPPRLHPYGISITQQAELPIVLIVTRAPTVADARGLAAAAPVAVRQVVEAIQKEQRTPIQQRVTFRALGPAEAGVVDDAAGKKIAAALFIFLLATFLALIVAVPRLREAWRGASDLRTEWNLRGR